MLVRPRFGRPSLEPIPILLGFNQPPTRLRVSISDVLYPFSISIELERCYEGVLPQLRVVVNVFGSGPVGVFAIRLVAQDYLWLGQGYQRTVEVDSPFDLDRSGPVRLEARPLLPDVPTGREGTVRAVIVARSTDGSSWREFAVGAGHRRSSCRCHCRCQLSVAAGQSLLRRKWRKERCVEAPARRDCHGQGDKVRFGCNRDFLNLQI